MEYVQVAKKLFRDEVGDVKEMLNVYEGISYKESPLDFFILLARYKFCSRFIKNRYKVIDAGCGRGYGSVFLASCAAHVDAIDFDDALIEANKKSHKDTLNLSFSKLNLLDVPRSMFGLYDALISLDVIEHFEQHETERVVRAYADLIREGGFAIVGTPNVASRPFASERRRQTHPFEFSDEQFEAALRKAFSNVFMFSMTDEIVSTQFPKLSWYLMAICTK